MIKNLKYTGFKLVQDVQTVAGATPFQRFKVDSDIFKTKKTAQKKKNRASPFLCSYTRGGFLACPPASLSPDTQLDISPITSAYKPQIPSAFEPEQPNQRMSWNQIRLHL